MSEKCTTQPLVSTSTATGSSRLQPATSSRALGTWTSSMARRPPTCSRTAAVTSPIAGAATSRVVSAPIRCARHRAAELRQPMCPSDRRLRSPCDHPPLSPYVHAGTRTATRHTSGPRWGMKSRARAGSIRVACRAARPSGALGRAPACSMRKGHPEAPELGRAACSAISPWLGRGPREPGSRRRENGHLGLRANQLLSALALEACEGNTAR